MDPRSVRQIVRVRLPTTHLFLIKDSMGFILIIVIWAIPAILFVGLVAALLAATGDRPGVQEGFRVSPRLRIVDAASVGFYVVTQLFVMLFWIMLPWHEFFLNEVAPFWWLVGGFAIGLVVVLCLASIITTFTLRSLFRQGGVLTAEQAKFFPLRARKLRIDPWPRCWQEPCPRHLPSQIQSDKLDIRTDGECSR
jgi:hypothetical protein